MAKRTIPMGIVPMEQGERDKAVTLEQLTSPDAAGTSRFPVEAWTTLATNVYASKVDMAGKERFRGDQLSAPYDTRWEINYRADMDPDLLNVPKKRRIVFKGRTYDIVSASEIGRHDGIELLTLGRPN